MMELAVIGVFCPLKSLAFMMKRSVPCTSSISICDMLPKQINSVNLAQCHIKFEIVIIYHFRKKEN